MTLIAFATYGSDRAEFITDSTSYTLRVSNLGRCSKHLTIHHLDAAVLTQGSGDFGTAAKTGLLTASGKVSNFDELADVAPEVLRVVWDGGVELGDVHPDADGIVFLLGWSDRDGKWRAYGFPSEDGFEPVKIPGLFVTPSPWEIRPSKMEHARVSQWWPDHPDNDIAMKLWSTKPARPAPRTRQEWVDLAIEAREQRSLSGTYGRVIVAGDVFHTVLKRGTIETRKVHTFNDTGDEFLRMVEWTEHPQALAMRCHCESGRPWGDCHALEEPCGCRSGKPFGECCMLQVVPNPSARTSGG